MNVDRLDEIRGFVGDPGFPTIAGELIDSLDAALAECRRLSSLAESRLGIMNGLDETLGSLRGEVARLSSECEDLRRRLIGRELRFHEWGYFEPADRFASLPWTGCSCGWRVALDDVRPDVDAFRAHQDEVVARELRSPEGTE